MKPPPNPAPPVDGGIPLQLHIRRAWPSATEEHRWAGGAVAKANQPQRGDMFIAQPNRNLRKPRRGGMVPSRTSKCQSLLTNDTIMNAKAQMIPPQVAGLVSKVRTNTCKERGYAPHLLPAFNDPAASHGA